MTLTVETFFQKTDWNRVLQFFSEHDFVHTFDFHDISRQNGEGQPIMFAVRDAAQNYIAFWPALRRDIPSTNYTDLTSVYGYAGPLFTEKKQSQHCLSLIFEEMRKIGVVTVFSRMHPLFIDQIEEQTLRGEKLGDVIAIETQRQTPLAAYRSAHRYEIRKALASGLTLYVDERCEKKSEFFEIYQASMRDLNASDYYFFNLDYFERMACAKDFKSFFIFAEHESKKIAASMFIITRGSMQYYLSGTVGEYRRLSPSKAIIAKAHEIAKDMGVERLILGGGVGSKEDQLFAFKNGFSDLRMPFYVFKRVIDEQAYAELCRARALEPTDLSYFPAYRLPANNS
jgi:hypothetical protein